ncbi:MAG TPA: Mu-like prophage major head subunit gpT family protein [Anaerohalosphaeraceae bacterium]|nr:Mu-like prophage major head subunit gpT family protein [Anaerohalosphaeraceae bacterium]
MKTDYPQTMHFECPLTIEAAGDEKQVPQFSMVAYTGGPMKIAGFTHPVVVDLEGLAIERQNIPIRLDHHPKQGVGHTHRVAVENGQVIAEGFISRDTSWARDVAKSGSRGFPWQASIGADILEAEFVPNGQSIQVNGRTLQGPLYVIRKSILKEISFVDSGADTNTTAQVAAQSKEENPMKKESKEKQTDLQTEVTPQPAPEKIEATATAVADPDPVLEIRKQVAGETKRIQAIRTVCNGKFPDIEAKAIEEGWDVTRCELEVLRCSRPKAPAVHVQKPVHPPQIFEAVAMMAAGIGTTRLEAMYDTPTLEAADKLRGIGIQEFCEQVVGLQLPRFRRDASGWLQAAFSTTSLPGILSNVANKMLLEGYNYIEDAWRRICKIASVNDFKEHTRYRMTGSFQFQQVGPDGELKHGKLEEMQYGQKADTHGIMFALTRQMIINDDLGAFADIPRSIGMGAAEAIADAVWGLLLSNPNSFFSTAHKNYLEGADMALSVDGLTAAEILFGEQTKPNGRPLGIGPTILLVPIALKVIAEQLMKSVNLNETTTANKAKPQANPHVGKFEVVSSSYLSNTSFPGSSSKAWYLFADPNRLPAIEVAFLNGVDRPTVEKTDADFNTLGIQFRGYIDFGVREQDFRGAAKFKGEA